MAHLKRDRASHLKPPPKPRLKPVGHSALRLLAQLPIAVSFTAFCLSLPLIGSAQTNITQVPAPNVPPLRPQDITPRPTPSPQLPQIPSPQPSPGNLLQEPSLQQPEETAPDRPFQFQITAFKFEGSTVFKDDALLAAIVEALKLDPAKPLPRVFTFAELLEARSAITKLYIDKGYITSGALIPAEQIIPKEGGAVTIQIVEGGLEDIKVTGNRRLQSGYISSRLAIATRKPLNQPRLLDALQLLSQSPLIEKISAELTAGSQFGSNLLEVTVKEARVFHGEINLDNDRSPAVGSFRRGVTLSDDNLLGFGDSLTVAYANTEGSNAIDLSYVVPVSPHNATLQFRYNATLSNVIEAPFNALDISSKYRTYELTLRHPFIRSSNEELAAGITFSRAETDTALGFENIGPFPLSPGADPAGRTRLSILRFFQEYTQRKPYSVLALRSEFSVGLNLFNATINEIPPDSEFFVWRGQAQKVFLLGPDTPLVLRGNVQVADRPLVAIEQFAVGGQFSVRGYRQDFLLSDNGAFGSVEVRLPLFRFPESQTLIQLVPFIDVGTVWSNSENSNLTTNTLVSTGLGLRLQVGDRVDFRFDWGIPLVTAESGKNSLQEQGLYFSLLWKLF
ncbi:MAG: ShlB/FhaC/HecB family hemolysin secretion/activation protein [Lyngbya sp. HA4199-MV5]|nr:ShlB/FhaC/HecB family hemolysin secretion/activation protein [Lyngbya sp. HA4199-MV5]